MRPVPRLARAAAAATALVALAALAGCSDDGDASATPETVTTTTADRSATTAVPQPVGDPVSRYQLAVGDCFNSYDDIEVTTRVPCDAPHDAEVFHFENHPAAFGERYPGNREMERYALRVCYAQFEAFTGGLYEVSRLDIGAVTPNQENFEDARARYRGITCYLEHAAGEPLVGSMRGRAE